MTYIFYDTETTGLNLAFDQILQFAAIVTDENFVEKGRFECRCRLLPWVVPSPTALVVTGVSPDDLNDPELPCYFEMMGRIKSWLDQWNPAVYIGFNSMRFDEQLLHRAFWQTLHPPYLTVSNGNSRLDILPIVRALSQLRPQSLNYPLSESGKLTFKLDRLAPENGFNAHNAHDAMGDVEATIFIAKKIRNNARDIWDVLSNRTQKSDVSDLLNEEQPIYFAAGKSTPFWGRRIDKNRPSSKTIIANLDPNWTKAEDLMARGEPTEENMKKFIHTISMNKAPVIFSQLEALDLFGEAPTDKTQENLRILEKLKLGEVLKIFSGFSSQENTNQTLELEQTIYDGFATKNDTALMLIFQKSDWQNRLTLVDKFSNFRFKKLAMRIIYLSAPDLLSKSEQKDFQLNVQDRLSVSDDLNVPWRTYAKAKAEISKIDKSDKNYDTYQKIKSWLRYRELDELSS